MITGFGYWAFPENVTEVMIGEALATGLSTIKPTVEATMDVAKARALSRAQCWRRLRPTRGDDVPITIALLG
ncbi:MAG TPA: hypothetical protein VKR22_11480 [Acidimicrobiales bacterium]|nr:hypothetical protein [Acidimicrobiales bacterium]